MNVESASKHMAGMANQAPVCIYYYIPIQAKRPRLISEECRTSIVSYEVGKHAGAQWANACGHIRFIHGTPIRAAINRRPRRIEVRLNGISWIFLETLTCLLDEHISIPSHIVLILDEIAAVVRLQHFLWCVFFLNHFSYVSLCMHEGISVTTSKKDARWTPHNVAFGLVDRATRTRVMSTGWFREQSPVLAHVDSFRSAFQWLVSTTEPQMLC